MGRSLEERGKYWDFGQRLKAALARKGWWGGEWTYQKIGKKLCDVSHTSVNWWVNGRKLPSTEHAIEIGLILDVSLDWLLAGRGSMDLSPIREDIVYTSRLPTEAKNTIKGIVQLYENRAAP